MTAMTSLQRKLANGEVILLDGAIGTELQHRGAAMDSEAWCARATGSHGDLLGQIHEDYIRAGAEVIIANTYANSRHMLEAAGLGDAVAELTTRAVEIARAARDRAAAGRPVAVAGSMSIMRPMVPGTDRRDPARAPSAAQAKANYRETAELLAAAGAELIAMEMMTELEHAGYAVEAAVATGLPVWVGFSCHGGPDGPVLLYDKAPLAEAIEPIMSLGGTVAGIMHSSIEDTTPALEVLMEHWSGPVAVYPESGHFEMPDWQFVDLIAPQDFADRTRRWVEAGAQIVGGCCGIGPAHIAALQAVLPGR